MCGSFRRSSPLAARGARRPTITRCRASWCSKLRSNVTWASMPASSSHPPGSSRCHARWEHTHSIIIPPSWLIKMPRKVRTRTQHHHPSLLAHQDATKGGNTHTTSSSHPPGSSRCHARWEHTHSIIIPPSWLIKMPHKVRTHTQHHHPTLLAHQDATQGENTHTASSSHPPGSSRCHARWEHTHSIIIPPSWLIKMPRKVRTHTQHHHPTLLAHQDATQGENTHTTSSSHPTGSSRCHARWEHTHSIIIPPSWLIKMPRKVRTHTQHHHPSLLAHQDATKGGNTRSIIIPPSWLIKMPLKFRTVFTPR